ncbi:hypothetical protein NADFUDRAFT_81154 [Nadsonia fulvescens var. elongata DSM 6958]|uniref:Helicase C-terminal domain-containing protein n=1 Tax=Nadsonia fulvescens var. elongata DSM 6958 TaxID=857566 RepID=A0A1E3PRL8_9ASCO|nr:hypothetical protein NADFUDRAFT_81154 [Nadsonia fulvescens var. elongata DSM 6958]
MARHDGLKLGKAMDIIVYHRDFIGMIKDGWLCDVNFTTVKTSTDMKQVKTASTGDYDLGSLSKAVNTIKNNELLVRMWFKNREEHHIQSTLIFCVDIGHVESLTALFRQRGVDARFVTSATKRATRDIIIEDFKAKKFPVMINCGVFSEGTDIPNIDCVILNRPTRSKNLLVQMIGRGMRRSEGKINCYVYDFVGNVDSNIITVPTLLGLDPDMIVNNSTMQDLIEQKESQDAKLIEIEKEMKKKELDSLELTAQHQAKLEQEHTQVTTKTYSSITDIVGRFYGNTYGTRPGLAQLRSPINKSRYAWVPVAQNKFVLNTDNGDLLKLEYNNETKSFTFSRRSSSYGWTRQDGTNIRIQKNDNIFEGILDSGQAVAAAETYIGNTYKTWSLLKTARFRAAPATPKQVGHIREFLRKNYQKLQEYKNLETSHDFDMTLSNDSEKTNRVVARPTGIRILVDKINANEINKGEAGDLITMMHNGGFTNLINDSKSLLKKTIKQRKSDNKKLQDQKLRELKESTKRPTKAERLRIGHNIKVGELE